MPIVVAPRRLAHEESGPPAPRAAHGFPRQLGARLRLPAPGVVAEMFAIFGLSRKRPPGQDRFLEAVHPTISEKSPTPCANCSTTACLTASTSESHGPTAAPVMSAIARNRRPTLTARSASSARSRSHRIQTSRRAIPNRAETGKRRPPRGRRRPRFQQSPDRDQRIYRAAVARCRYLKHTRVALEEIRKAGAKQLCSLNNSWPSAVNRWSNPKCSISI